MYNNNVVKFEVKKYCPFGMKRPINSDIIICCNENKYANVCIVTVVNLLNNPD